MNAEDGNIDLFQDEQLLTADIRYGRVCERAELYNHQRVFDIFAGRNG